jgi:hypothetical protein
MKKLLDRTPKYSIFITIAAVLLIIIITILLQSQWTPKFGGIMGADSGLFAYGGQQILAGKMLYRDVWDTKPPLTFYLNALALWLFGETPWALWIFDVIWIGIAAVILFLTLKRITGPIPAGISIFFFLVVYHNPKYYEGGNFTEIYALIPQVLALWAYMHYLFSRRRKWIFIMGSMMAFAILSKPTDFAIGMAVLLGVLYLDVRQRSFRKAVKNLILAGAGAAAPILLVTVYFGIYGLLSDLWYAVITYDVIYAKQVSSRETLKETWRVIRESQPLATLFYLMIPSLLLFFAKNLRWLFSSSISDETKNIEDSDLRKEEAQKLFFMAVFISLPIEFAMTAISGWNFGHYFLMIIPALASSGAYLFYWLDHLLEKRARQFYWLTIVLVGVVVIVGWTLNTAMDSLPNHAELRALFLEGFNKEDAIHPVDWYIIEHSKPDESVLVWSIQPMHNFVTGRRAPSRYVFASQLLLPNIDNEAMLTEFLEDVWNDPPALILSREKRLMGIPYLGESDNYFCSLCPPEALEKMYEFRAYVKEYYIPVEYIGEWTIYHRLE